MTHLMRLLAMSSAALLPLGPCHAQNDVHVEQDAVRDETVYRIEAPDCRIEWSSSHSQTNAGIVQQRTKCALPLADQIAMIEKLLATKLQSEPEATFHTLFLGSTASLPELSFRLASAAQQSAIWDEKRGKPKSSAMNRAVVDLANQAHVLDELQTVFAKQGRTVTVASVEKVFVRRVRDLHDAARLQSIGARPNDRLPYDCLLWLRVAPSAE